MAIVVPIAQARGRDEVLGGLPHIVHKTLHRGIASREDLFVAVPLEQLPGQQFSPLRQPLPPDRPGMPRSPFRPVFLFYTARGLIATIFLVFSHWEWIQNKLGSAFYPLLLFTISAAPIIINVLITTRFPNGPLSNAEGMALRQIPVLFVALALVAWEYELLHVILFSVATTALELGLIYSVP